MTTYYGGLPTQSEHVYEPPRWWKTKPPIRLKQTEIYDVQAESLKVQKQQRLERR